MKDRRRLRRHEISLNFRSMGDQKLRCFVAMAFGWDDTDRMYSNFVKKFRGRFNIRRVDRINHNNDIDDQIIRELNEADFVVADLTYARPSVYFEAGYAQGRPIGVVYTARIDHVGKKATEDSLRVHFDLQMRNIVVWKTPDDAGFFRALDKRIGLVAGPLLRDRSAAEAREQRKREFAALSQHRQLDAITYAAESTLNNSAQFRK